jgi:hypothetical protein
MKDSTSLNKLTGFGLLKLSKNEIIDQEKTHLRNSLPSCYIHN